MGCTMGGGVHSNGETVSLEIPAGLFEALEKAGKRKRQSVVKFLAEMLEDRQDVIDSQRIAKRIKEGKEQAVPWAEARKRLSEAP